VRIDHNRSFVIADIPGLIEGAAEGAGLGHRFLKHLARTGILLHLVDLAPFNDETDPVAEARAIVEELRKYDEALYQKPRWLVLNKLDMLSEEERKARIDAFLVAYDWPTTAIDPYADFDLTAPRVYTISGLTGDGCLQLCRDIMTYLDITRPQRADAMPTEAEQALAPYDPTQS